MKNIRTILTFAALTLAACGGSSPPPSDPSTSTSATPPDAKDAKDTDGDGVPDAMDKCPDKKEDGQAPDAKDGCPKP
jgi:hypothetical protein